jgi:hypothetical protein
MALVRFARQFLSIPLHALLWATMDGLPLWTCVLALPRGTAYLHVRPLLTPRYGMVASFS